MLEDARLFTDREHEINGLDREGIPSALLGGDIILTPASARSPFNENTENLAITIELAEPADVYLLFVQPEVALPGWIEQHYEPTDIRVGFDYGPVPRRDTQFSVGIGPGVSIDRDMQVWKRKQVAVGRVLVGGPLPADFSYSLIAVPVP